MMTSISTEDKGAMVEIRGGKGLGLYVFAALLALLIACSVAISQPYISDTNASTYVIIPLFMLPVFALFMLKDAQQMNPQVDGRSILAGVLFFAMLIVLSLDLRAAMGPLFFGYRIDALLMPLAISGLALLIYGRSNLRMFGWIALYSIFASPLLLYPIVNANLGFASLNTDAIFQIARLFFHGLGFSAPITLTLNGNAVSIGNTCIGIGALIGIGMLLAPIAYLMDGRPRAKVLWVAGGIVLMLALNFLRMLGIAIAWFYYGPSNSILSVHDIAGQVIFYATLIVMVLVLGKAGLSFPRAARRRPAVARYSATGIALAVALSVLYFAITLSYLGSSSQAQSQPIGAGLHFTWANAASIYGSQVSFQGSTYSAMGNGNQSAVIVLVNSSGPDMSSLVLFAESNGTAEGNFIRNASAGRLKEYLDGSRIAYVYEASNGTLAYFSRVPYYTGQGYYTIDMYVIGIAEGNASCIGAYGMFYDTIANIAQLNPGLFNAKTDNGYCSVVRILR